MRIWFKVGRKVHTSTHTHAHRTHHASAAVYPLACRSITKARHTIFVYGENGKKAAYMWSMYYTRLFFVRTIFVQNGKCSPFLKLTPTL